MTIRSTRPAQADPAPQTSRPFAAQKVAIEQKMQADIKKHGSPAAVHMAHETTGVGADLKSTSVWPGPYRPQQSFIPKKKK